MTPRPDTDPLDRLQQIAEEADNGSPWEWEHAYPQRITRVGDVVLVADCFEDPDSPSRFAEFIATFDPPTVLALVAVARAARSYVEAEGADTDALRALLNSTNREDEERSRDRQKETRRLADVKYDSLVVALARLEESGI